MNAHKDRTDQICIISGMSTSEQISFSKHHSHFKLEALLQVKFFSAKYKFVAKETFKGQNCNINTVKPLEKYFTLKVAVQKNAVEESSNLCTSSLFCQIEHLMERKGAPKKRRKVRSFTKNTVMLFLLLIS